jgi:molecular chaperone GrpE
MTTRPVEGDATERPPEDADGAAPSVSEAAEPPAPPQTDAERIASLEAEVAELKEAHARAVADHLNYRRRSEQHWTERARATLADTVSRYLPLLDDLDRAVGNVDPELDGHQWVEGVRLVHHKFHETLAASGLEAIATEDAAFDPQVHEAISYAPGPEGRVIASVRAGYHINDYVVRPAQVVVGDGTGPDGTAPQRQE